MRYLVLLAALCLLAPLFTACTSDKTAEALPQDTATRDPLATILAEQRQPTAVPTEAPSSTPTPSPTATATPTSTPSATATFTATFTSTSTSTPTATNTVTASATLTSTLTLTPSAAPSLAPSATVPATLTRLPTQTQTQISIAAQATQPPTLVGSPTPDGFVPSVVPIPANPSPTQVLISPPTLVPTLLAGVIPTNTPRFSPTPTLAKGDHFWFWRPFPRDPSGRVNDTPARGYAYGSTAGNSLQVHKGIDIENPTGTSIQAIGSGTVFYAGADVQILFGPQPDFYGNVIVIEHDYLAPDGRQLFSLYGHLSRVLVAVGDHVEYGQVIGAVGAEGVAFGPHLHVEIRIGDPYSYNATYNPELWILPWENYGVFAARVLAPDGQPAKNVRVELIGRGSFISGWTYADDTVNSDPYFGENIVIGDIRSGQYDLKVGEIRNIVYRDVVDIKPGVVNMIEIQLPALPEE